MSKQQEIYSLFRELGIKTPQERRDERIAQQQAYFRSLQSPESRAGAGIGMALASLFGKPSEEDLRDQAMAAAQADSDTSSQITMMMSTGNALLQSEDPELRSRGAQLLARGSELQQARFKELREEQAAKQAQDASFLKTTFEERVVPKTVTDPLTGLQKTQYVTVRVPFQYDVRDPQGTMTQLGGFTPAPSSGGDSGKPDPDVRPSVDLSTRRVLRNGAEVAQGSDGQFYTIVRGADGKAYQGNLVADPKFAPTKEEQAIIEQRSAQPIIQIGPKVTKEERDRRALQQPSTAADDQLNPFSLF